MSKGEYDMVPCHEMVFLSGWNQAVTGGHNLHDILAACEVFRMQPMYQREPMKFLWDRWEFISGHNGAVHWHRQRQHGYLV